MTGKTSTSARLAGLIVYAQAQPDLKPRIIVSGLRPADRQLCVTIARANNLYEAKFEFLNPLKGPTVEVAFESLVWKRLGAMTPEEMAISVHPAASGRCDKAGDLLPSAWSPAVAPQSVVALYNAGQADQVKIQVGVTQATACAPIDQGLSGRTIVAIRFTHVCPIPSAPIACGQRLNASIQRSVGAEYAEPDRFSVRRSCF